MKYLKENTNFIGSDGLTYNIYIGNQTTASLKKVYQDLTTITTELIKKKKSILVLTDITKLGSLNLSARRFAVELLKNVEFEKVAIFGNPILMEQFINFIILASGRGYKMKYFSKEKEAKRWLKTK